MPALWRSWPKTIRLVLILLVLGLVACHVPLEKLVAIVDALVDLYAGSGKN